MEELRSSDALDREIRQDAQRKARRILNDADQAIGLSEKSWDKKIYDDIDSMTQSYRNALSQRQREMRIRLPLDQRLLRLAMIDSLLQSAATEYLAGLSRETMHSLIKMEAEKRLGAVDLQHFENPEQGSLHFTVQYQGFSPDELERALKELLGSRVTRTVAEDPMKAHPDALPALVLDSPALRISVSVEDLVLAMLEEKRAELAVALFGEEALDV